MGKPLPEIPLVSSSIKLKRQIDQTLKAAMNFVRDRQSFRHEGNAAMTLAALPLRGARTELLGTSKEDSVMTTTTIELDRVSEISDAIPEGTPFHMLNLLRFRERAAYAEGVNPAGGTGREAFLDGYMPAFQQVVATLGFSGIGPVFAGEVVGAVVGNDAWDAAAIVAYPDFATFRRIVESSEYASIAEPHRLAALEDLQLIATLPMDAR